MTMPVLPALMAQPGAEPASSALIDLLSELDEGTMTELIATAEAGAVGAVGAVGAGEGAEEDADAIPGEEMEDVDVDAEPEAGDVAEAEGQGFDKLTTWAESAVEALTPQLDAIAASLEAASAGIEAGAEPDSIEPLQERAEELVEQANELLGECHDAAGAEDAHTCAIAALRIDKIARVVAKLVEQAATFAETTSAPEAGFEDEPAVKLWAQRTAGPTGPITV